MTRGALVMAVVLCLGGFSSVCAVAQTGSPSVDQARAKGSLRGTDLDGEWVVTRLRVDAALLRRFDHLLTAVGEVGLPEMRRWVRREVTRQHGAAAATQVLAAWDEHLKVLQGQPIAGQDAASNPFPTSEPARTASARDAALPTPYALLTPDPLTSTEQQQVLHAKRVERLGADAAERLRAEDAERWAWAQRLAQARTQMQGLSGEAREAHLARQFSGSELLRARTLLGLPP